MAKMSPGEKLEADLKKILEDYANGVTESMQELIRAAAAKGKGTLRSTSPRSSGLPNFGKKHYADQWAVRDESTRLTANAIIYNKAPTYRLAHLLENGYTRRDGRRVSGRPHIKPVEDTIIQEVTQGIMREA